MYHMDQAIQKARECAQSSERSGRDESISLPWNNHVTAVLFAYGKLTRCILRLCNQDGVQVGHQIMIDRALEEIPDVIAYLARAYGLMKLGEECEPMTDVDSVFGEVEG